MKLLKMFHFTDRRIIANSDTLHASLAEAHDDSISKCITLFFFALINLHSSSLVVVEDRESN